MPAPQLWQSKIIPPAMSHTGLSNSDTELADSDSEVDQGGTTHALLHNDVFGLNIFPADVPTRENTTFFIFPLVSCWKWRTFRNLLVEKYSQYPFVGWKTFSFSFSVIFHKVSKKTTKSRLGISSSPMWRQFKTQWRKKDHLRSNKNLKPF